MLSNNDGCIVARSQEVKDLKTIPMGAPVFKYKKEIEANNVKLISANFALYGDMSTRVMNTLSTLCPNVEIYSIDEAFLKVDGIDLEKLEEFGKKIRDRVLKWTGIPVSVGIAKTKTLCKIANELVKKQKIESGVLDFSKCNQEQIDSYLKQVPVEDIWGVGWRSSEKLKAINVQTALDFKNLNDQFVRKKLNVTGSRTQLELRNIECIKLEDAPINRKSIASTRSFGKKIHNIEELKQAVSYHTKIASKKLRRYNSVASAVLVFIKTNRFSKNTEYYSKSWVEKIIVPTSDLSELTKAAVRALERIYKPDLMYKKAGVCLLGLIPKQDLQLDFFEQKDKKKELSEELKMKSFDKINRKWGNGTLVLASEGVTQKWHSKRELVSPNYTTNWGELLVVGHGQN